MVRTKYQRGSLKRIGNGQYIARWRRYAATPSGEKATPRKKIITKELAAKYRIGQNYPGPLTKSDAQRLLDILITEDTGKCLAPDLAATFEQLARQYISVKEPRWGVHAEATTKSIIQKHLIGSLGHRRVDELTVVEIRYAPGKRSSTPWVRKIRRFTCSSASRRWRWDIGSSKP
jgi:hypothetical protein